MEPSLFTRIINRDIPAYIIYEDETTIAFLDITPVSSGHTLVVPKQQVDLLWDLDDDTYAHLMVVTRQLAQHLQDILEPVRIGEMVEGFGVPHAHIHLIPINANFEVTLKEHWQNRQQLDSQEGERLQTLLKI